MTRKLFLVLGVVLATLVVGAPAFAQVGIFDKTADWGKVGTYKVAGSAALSGSTYNLKGNGNDIWDSADEGFFLYKELSGSQSISGKAHWISAGGNEWAKVGLMMREKGAVAGSRHYWCSLRGGTAGNGDRIDAQWRSAESAASGNVEIQANGASVPDPGDGLWIRVSRIAPVNLVLIQYSTDGTNWVYGDCREFTFADTIAYGLAITNHDDNEVIAEASVSDVKIETTVPGAGLRSFSITDPVYIGGDPITVTITVGGGSGALTVTETPPSGWAISAISDGGTATGGTITWKLNAAKKITYVVTPPAGATAAATFTGKVDSTLTAGSNSLVAPSPIEIFDNHLDVGAVGAAGAAEYDKTLKRYIVSGSGADIWDTADEFHFVYKKLSGAFSLEATLFAYNDTGTNEWSKAGIMVRDELTAGSSHLMAIVRGSDAQYDSQWRAAANSSSGDSGLKTASSGQVRLVRSGSTVEAFYLADDGTWTKDTTQTIALADPVYVGLCVTSHDDGNMSVGEYENVLFTLYPFQLSKKFSAQEVSKGSFVDVVLSAEVREGQTPNITIKEAYPAAVSISNLKASKGQAADDKKGNITWSLTGATGTVTLQYTLNVPSDYVDSFVDISGTYDDGKGYAGSSGSTSLAVKAASLGIFQGHQDIGSPGASGNVKVDGDSYQVIGSGHDIWDSADDFHFLWLRVSGDFSMSVDDPYVGAYGANPSANDWMKMGIMARQELTAPSAYVYGCLRASDQALQLQWRDASATAANNDSILAAVADWNPNYDPAFPETGRPALDQVKLGGTMKLVRETDSFTLYYVLDGEDQYLDLHDLAMTDPIYLGIAVTSHQTGATAQGLFKNPKLVGNAVSVGSWMLY